MSELKVNTISEVTGANGVVIDSVKLKDGGVIIADAGNIGSASDTDALAISSGGVVTFTQKPVINSGVAIDNITIDGTEIDLSSGDLTIDVAGDIILDADGGDLKFADGGTDLLSITNSSSDVVIKPLVDAKDIIFQQYDGTEVARIEDNATFNVSSAGKFAYAGTAVTATAAELNILDGVTATAAEINLIDGGTARGTTAIADGDGVLINDAGTMRQTTVETLATYVGAEIGGGNPITSADTWRLTTDFSGGADPISSNLEQNDDASFYGIGTAMSVSSGIFTFPETGQFYITATFQTYNATSQTQGNIYYTTNNSSYSVGANCRTQIASTSYGAMTTSMIFDVTNTTNCKVKFVASSGGTIMGNSGYNGTHFQFIRIGST
jgi:hypothetical protein